MKNYRAVISCIHGASERMWAESLYSTKISLYQSVLAGRYSPNTLRSTPQISPKVA